MVHVVKTSKKIKVFTIINDATFSGTVTGADMDLREYDTLLITYKLGTESDAGTMDIVFQVKDSVGNYITHTTLAQITAAGSGYEEITGLAASYGRIVCTFGGTGTFLTTTVEATAAK